MEKIDKNTKLKDLPEEVVEKLFKEAWERYQERKKKGRSENSKNGDKERAKTEFVPPTGDKGDSGKTGKSGKSVPEIPEIPESQSAQVGKKNSKTSKEDEKNEISAEEFITQETVEGKDSRYKVKISVYRIGEEEKIEGDKVVRRAKLKFVISYRDTVRECVDDCINAIREVAKATGNKVSKGMISETLSDLRKEYGEKEEIPLVDYVREKYPDRLAEIEKDPFGWIMSHTKEIVGYDRLKLLTFLSVVSSQLKRVMGMSRIHLMLVGKSGAGKSSTIKSVIRYIDGTDMYIPGTRLTQNSLGYMPVDTYDGKVLFIEQIDKQNINYIREAMTEDRICTLVTEKETGEDGNEHLVSHLRCTPGQPTIITTSVADNIDVDREQIFNRFLKVYTNPESLDTEKVVEAILTRQSTEVSEVDKLVFMAYLKTRPPFADITPVLDQAKKFVLSLQEYTREPLTRVTEVLRNLIITTAIARGKTEADESDFQFVMDNFQLDVFYDGLGLTEGDVEIIKLLPDDGSLTTSEIAGKMKMSDEMARKTLHNLEKKGVVYGYTDTDKKGRPLVWTLTELGRQIKALVNNINTIKHDKPVVKVNSIDEKAKEVVEKFETCLGFSLGAISYQLYARNEVKEEQLMNLFKDENDVVHRVEECLPVLGYHQEGDMFIKRKVDNTDIKNKSNVMEEPNNSVTIPDYKCTTIWFISQYNELKGKTLKVKDIDEDLMMCLKIQNKVEVIDNETVHIKED
ncbi:hypothetical protein [Saccharolobus islandicus]|nr:hypothetical protein [Sulfolobus islandicus]